MRKIDVIKYLDAFLDWLLSLLPRVALILGIVFAIVFAIKLPSMFKTKPVTQIQKNEDLDVRLELIDSKLMEIELMLNKIHSEMREEKR